ncbi:hypothetical protein V501_05354 [Pseudogymnoascus sp. VKM F-4519 (FW-2642)]|nr:hypothetical protein V501_05354 [Pseudogymnoascus sp. VKM F-4519 (FW-2642)]
MEEMFCITAPRARRRFPQQDKLRHIFFNGRDSKLVLFLIVPARLKKQSQNQAAAYSAVSATSAASAASTTSDNSAVTAAVTAELPQSGGLGISPAQKATVGPWNPAASAVVDIDPAPTFKTLPLEIYSMIFGHLDDLTDIICVGYAAPYLWGIIQGTIYQWYKSMLGMWADEPIVRNVFGAAMGPRHARCFNLTYPHSGIVDYASLTANALASRTYYACLRRFDRYPSFELRAELLWIYTERPDFTPRQESWILRNLTRKEFVTAEGIALEKDFIDGPFIFGIGFGDVVVARTLWSSKGTSHLGYRDQIGRGIWAGHRFDIITRSQHDEATKGEEWKDVSAEVRLEIAGIWESQYGPNWVDERNFRGHFDDDVVSRDERDVAHDLDVAMDEFYNGFHEWY